MMRYLIFFVLILGIVPGVQAQQNEQSKFKCYTGADAFMRHLEQAGIYRGNRDMSAALEHYECAVAIDDLAWIAYRGRGFTYSAIGKHELALEDFDTALLLKPDDALTYFQKGMTLQRLQRYDEAIITLSEAIRLNPSHGMSYNWRAIAWRESGHFDKAAQDFHLAARVGIPNEEFIPYINLGNLYQKQNNLVEAVYWYEQAAAATPGQSYIYELLGDTYMKLNNTAAAEKYYMMYIGLTNTARVSILDMVEISRIRMIALRYLPLILAGIIMAGLLIRLAILRYYHRLHKTSTTPSQPQPESPASKTWLAFLFTPIVGALAFILRELGNASE